MTSPQNNQISTNPFNQRMQQPVRVAKGSPELVTVSAGSYAAAAHTPQATVVASYLALQVNGGPTTLHSGSNVNGVTLSQVDQAEPVTSVRAIVTLDNSTGVTDPATTGEIRLRGYNTKNLASEYAGLLNPGVYNNYYSQCPKLNADLCTQSQARIQILLSNGSSFNIPSLLQARILPDATVALTVIPLSTGGAFTAGVEVPLTAVELNTALGLVTAAAGTATLSVYGTLITGLDGGTQ